MYSLATRTTAARHSSSKSQQSSWLTSASGTTRVWTCCRAPEAYRRDREPRALGPRRGEGAWKRCGVPALKIEIDTARPQDAEHVLRLVKENRLTTDGLLDPLATILVGRLDQRIVGTA